MEHGPSHCLSWVVNESKQRRVGNKCLSGEWLQGPIVRRLHPVDIGKGAAFLTMPSTDMPPLRNRSGVDRRLKKI